MIITRGLQEWACLLPQDLPFAPVARLLGWQSLDEALLCDTTVRNLVRLHGQIVRQAEADQVQALLARADLELSPRSWSRGRGSLVAGRDGPRPCARRWIPP